MYVGQIDKLGKGYWVGVKLDEPQGDTDGKVDGTQIFECQASYGIFVRPKEVNVGDFPEVDAFDEEFDEV